MAKEAWERLVQGETSHILSHDRIPVPQTKVTPRIPLIKIDTKTGFWLNAYVRQGQMRGEKVREANRIISILLSNNLDVFSESWWISNISEKGFSKALHENSRNILEVLGAPINNVKAVTRTYISKRMCIFIDALMFAKLMSDDGYPFIHFGKLADSIKIHFKSKASGEFRPGNNYQPLSLPDLEIFLEVLSKRGLPYYNFAILCLSTLIRYRDIKLLNPAFLANDGKLVYNKKVHGQYLSNKTLVSGKIEPSRLTNPTASIVTKVILRHLGFKPFDSKMEKRIFSPESKIRLSLSPAGRKNGVVRSLRTTGATMLAESEHSETCRKITKKEVAERLAHINTRMLDTVYGRMRPPEMGEENIDDYLDLPDIRINRVLVNSKEAAFDIWLLKNMLETYRGRKQAAELTKALRAETLYDDQKRKKRIVKV
ncbi:MAG: hypothetical protein NTX25_03550 [Proteobacteria bacterium]|nr:hypothetical protein [Pseudomonadota bacterium]